METTASLKKRNLLNILKIIRNNPRISRPEIVNEAKLSGSTVSTLIAELLRNNLIIEEGLADSSGGRKALLYSFNKDMARILSINMLMGSITIELFDMIGNGLSDRIELIFDSNQNVEKTLYTLIDAIKKFLEKNNLTPRDILGIGMSVPGRVDHELGIIHNLPNLKQWKDVPVKKIIESEIGIPFILDRDTNTNILYLAWNEFTDKKSKSVYASIVEGIGTGVIIDDNVYHGSHGLAGEMGHTTVVHSGLPCNCGNKGCVELYVSNRAIIKSYLDNLKSVNNDTTECDEVLGIQSAENKYIIKMAQKALTGDLEADSAFLQAVEYLKSFFVNIINTFDPQLLIIDCPWMKIKRDYFNETVSGVFDRINSIGRNDISIVLNHTPDIFSKSPYILVIEHMFSDLENNTLFSK